QNRFSPKGLVVKRILQADTRTLACRRNSYRPCLEPLEHRLPTGVVMGLPAWPWAALSCAAAFAWSDHTGALGSTERPLGDFDAPLRPGRYEFQTDKATDSLPSLCADRTNTDSAPTRLARV